VWPTDLLLLALRVAMVLLVAAAFGRPLLVPERRPAARVVLVDVSRAVASPDEALDSTRRHLQAGDRLVVFDTTTRTLPIDSSGAARGTGAPGSLSAALVAAAREARDLAQEAERVEIVLVSPLADEEVDSATAGLLALAGPLRLARVAAAAHPAASRVVFRGDDDDPLRAALTLATGDAGTEERRIVRGEASAEDSAWARAGGTLVLWPRDTAVARAGAAGLTTGRVTLVAAVAPTATPPDGRAVAWWADGAPAATEMSSGRGCIRRVAIPVPAAGDLVLRASFVGLVRVLVAPCGGERRLAPVPVERLVRQPAATAGPALARAPGRSHRDLTPWLLGAALLLALVELGLRRTERQA
jgi:hypothetical protein